MLPNAEHELEVHRISMFLSMRAFYLSILQNYKRPNITWTKDLTANGGMITFYTDTTPIQINSYYAVTLDGKRRDFRIIQQGPNGQPVPHPIVYHKNNVTNIVNRCLNLFQHYI